MNNIQQYYQSINLGIISFPKHIFLCTSISWFFSTGSMHIHVFIDLFERLNSRKKINSTKLIITSINTCMVLWLKFVWVSWIIFIAEKEGQRIFEETWRFKLNNETQKHCEIYLRCVTIWLGYKIQSVSL